jgi:hypothetical protein
VSTKAGQLQTEHRSEIAVPLLVHPLGLEPRTCGLRVPSQESRYSQEPQAWYADWSIDILIYTVVLHLFVGSSR